MIRVHELVWAAVITAACISRCSAATAPQYRIVDLGHFGLTTAAWDVNESGQCVVNGYNSYSVFRDSDGIETTIPLLANAMTCRQAALNSSGLTAGRDGYADGSTLATIWSMNTGKRCIGTLPGFQNSEAFDVNDSGMVVGRCYNSSTDAVGFVWTEHTGMVQLNNPTGSTITEAYGINSAGQVVGKTGTADHTNACQWDENGNVTFPAWGSEARAINDAGCQITNDVGFAEFWTSSGHRIAFFSGQARGLNDLNQVVGRFSGPTRYGAFVWSSSTGTIGLPELPGSNGGSALALNDYGVIAGMSAGRAVLWVPVPEPSTILALLTGLAGIGALAHKRRNEVSSM